MKTDIYHETEKDFGQDLKQAIEILDAHIIGLIDDRLLRAMVFLQKAIPHVFNWRRCRDGSLSAVI